MDHGCLSYASLGLRPAKHQGMEEAERKERRLQETSASLSVSAEQPLNGLSVALYSRGF